MKPVPGGKRNMRKKLLGGMTIGVSLVMPCRCGECHTDYHRHGDLSSVGIIV